MIKLINSVLLNLKIARSGNTQFLHVADSNTMKAQLLGDSLHIPWNHLNAHDAVEEAEKLKSWTPRKVSYGGGGKWAKWEASDSYEKLKYFPMNNICVNNCA